MFVLCLDSTQMHAVETKTRVDSIIHMFLIDSQSALVMVLGVGWNIFMISLVQLLPEFQIPFQPVKSFHRILNAHYVLYL